MKISSINYCGVVTRPAEIPNITENPHSWVRFTRKRAIPAFADGSEKMKLLISNWDHSSYYFLHSSSCEFGKNLLCVCDWTVWVWVGAYCLTSCFFQLRIPVYPQLAIWVGNSSEGLLCVLWNRGQAVHKTIWPLAVSGFYLSRRNFWFFRQRVTRNYSHFRLNKGWARYWIK